jgi:hypothetical protein
MFKKGIMGTETLLSVVSFLFLIGLVVMIFVLASGSLNNTNIVTSEVTSTVTQNEVNVTVDGTTLTVCQLNGGSITAIIEVNNSECSE